MYQITLSLPDETALALHLTPEQLAQQILTDGHKWVKT